MLEPAMAYAAEWDLDDAVLDRDEVEAVVQHVAALGHVAGEVTRSRNGLACTFRVPVALAADVVGALDPQGQLLGDDWYRDLDPPLDGDDGYVVRVELIGPVDGGRVDDGDGDGGAAAEPSDPAIAVTDQSDAESGEAMSEEDWEAVWRAGAALRTDPADDFILDQDEVEAEDDDSESAAVVARLRIEALDNREAWPVAFALASAIVERLGGDLRDDGEPADDGDDLGDDDVDEDELFQLQLHVPRVTGPAVAAHAEPHGNPRGASVTVVPRRPDTDGDDDDHLLN